MCETVYEKFSPPHPGNLLVDAEIISIAFEITHEIPALKQTNISFRINHTSLLRAILLFCNVPVDKYACLFMALSDFVDGKISKFQLQSTATGIMQASKYSAVQLIELLLVDAPLSGSRGSFSGSALRVLINGRGEASSLAKSAIRELECVISLAQGMGVQVRKFQDPFSSVHSDANSSSVQLAFFPV